MLADAGPCNFCQAPNCRRWWSRCLYIRMDHCSGLSGPKNGCGCEPHQAAPAPAKRSIDVISFARSRSKSHCSGCSGKSSGEDGELRRSGLSFPKTIGLMSAPTILAGKGARFGVMSRIAIRKPAVQCASVCATLMVPQSGRLSGVRRRIRCFVASATA